jgi:hypothetical protein
MNEVFAGVQLACRRRLEQLDRSLFFSGTLLWVCPWQPETFECHVVLD